ncbi:ferroxidase fet3 [Coemansia sp. RSA 520]|nr:ferroxidase fet3 [Coemansia sp. RSA 520]KAJ2647448.1 ferroxidase fet3 [Coemansia sp. RSA 1287]
MLRQFIVFAAVVFNCFAARVELNWDVGYVFGIRDGFTYRRAIGVNGELPFPPVHVTQGDTLVINVHNSLDVPTSIHAHGLLNNGTNYYDGPDMVTQCGIPPGESFTYVLETKNQFGTFWIHGHTRHQEVDGLHTPLIIHSRKQPVVDYDEELIMTFEDWFTTEFAVRQAYIDSLEDIRTLTSNFPKALINGYDGNKTAPIKFVPGKKYRLRVICMSINNWFKFRIPGHTMTLIEADGVESMPLEVDGLSMGPGQRYSVIVTAHDSDEFNYMYNVTSYSDALVSQGLTPMVYTGLINYRDGAPVKTIQSPADEQLVWPEETAIQVLDKQAELPVDRRIELTMKKFTYTNQEHLTTLGTTLYKPVLVPTLYTALSMGDLAANSSVYGPQTNAYVLKHLDVVEVVINNPERVDHTFHFHGHNVQVIETGPYGNSSTISREPVAHQQSGPWPMWRDTVQVRGFEFIRVRFRADNPGVWFMHCHLSWHEYNGVAVVFIEAPDVLQKQQSVPEEMVEMCKRQGIPTQGNGAGNQGFDLSGLPPAIYPISVESAN